MYLTNIPSKTPNIPLPSTYSTTSSSGSKWKYAYKFAEILKMWLIRLLIVAALVHFVVSFRGGTGNLSAAPKNEANSISIAKEKPVKTKTDSTTGTTTTPTTTITTTTTASQESSTVNTIAIGSTGSASSCPKAAKFGNGPPKECRMPSDPNKKPKSQLERWFTKEIFEDLFPFANLGYGPHPCQPYSYEAFLIAARYFPSFGTSSPNKVYTAKENYRRDVAAFFAHAVQETGENNAALYAGRDLTEANNCFYRGGFYNWFEGGPTSSFLDPSRPGYDPSDGEECTASGRYCTESAELNYWVPCDDRMGKRNSSMYRGCYFGRGAIQISYNYNYGLFMQWLKTQNITVDLLANPNLILTHMNPPLSILASLWFYMTPQPPKPAMHDIVMGEWNSGPKNAAAGYAGPIFGPTSLIINNECNGEDAKDPGGPGESRRIKAFKWFCAYFGVPSGNATTNTCKDMPVKLDALQYNYSYQPDWGTTWFEKPCNCSPAGYGGMIPYFDAAYYPEQFVALNDMNRQKCIDSIYDNPSMYSMNNKTSACLNIPQPGENATVFF